MFIERIEFINMEYNCGKYFKCYIALITTNRLIFMFKFDIIPETHTSKISCKHLTELLFVMKLYVTIYSHIDNKI